MYIKLSFREEVAIVPQCWGGLVIYLTDKPEIVSKLPKDTFANQPINEKPASEDNLQSSNYVPKSYDYYLDCEKAGHKTIEKALELFIKRYKGKHASAVVGDTYPEKNPIVSKLKIDLHRATPASSLLENSLFTKQISGKGKIEEENNSDQDINSLMDMLYS